jgi:DNA-binding ferritin-like protein (Dps family)
MEISDEMVKAAHAAHAKTMWKAGTSDENMRAALDAVAPLIRAAAMEDAAKIAEDEVSSSVPRALDNDDHWGPTYRKRIAAAIRAKETA